MADDFDPSPRPTKRHKTYASGRTILKSPQTHGALSSVSIALSSISNRILGRGKSQKPEELHDDSAYGSKEDSFNEDEILAAEEDERKHEMEPLNEESLVGTRGTRRSSRKSKEADGEGERGTSSTINEDNEAQRTSTVRSKTLFNTDSPQQLLPEAFRNGRRSTRKSQQSHEDGTPQASGKSATGKSRTSNKTQRKYTVEAGEEKTVVRMELEATEETLAQRSEEQDEQDERTVQDTVEFQPRSSGRERRKPRRFSIEPPATERPKPVEQISNKIRRPSMSRSASAITSPRPKGILTPSRRKRDGPRKSVAFDQSDKQIEEQFGFKDIEESSKKRKKGTKVGNNESTEQVEIPETPQHLPDNEEDIFLDPHPPQDVLQTLDLPSSIYELPSTAQPEDSSYITSIKSLVLSRLTSTIPSPSPPSHLSAQYSTIHTLLTSTIAAGESNSLLLLGSRGAGKSLLISTALFDLSSKHSDDFHVVRLNGFFQTDDRLALREIWRQLGREREGEVDEDETREVGGSYADTMASLLSLLSHPDDFDPDPDTMQLDNLVDDTTKTSKSVVIVLDEFDLFTMHPRQTLLYNLFDIAQSKKAPIAVIGCSTRMDVVECLEKRVKSRFSHRWVHVPGVKSAEGMRELLEVILCVEDKGDGAVEERETEREVERKEERLRWNEYIKSTFLTSPEIQSLIQQTFYTTKSIPDLLAALYIPIATLNLPAPSSTTPPTTITSGSKSTSKAKSKSTAKANSTATTPSSLPAPPLPNLTSPSILSLLPQLPTLHLSLLISAARLETLFSLHHLNFNAAHQHYLDLLSRSKAHSHSTFSSASGAAMRQWSKDVCRRAWEDLLRWEVLVPVTGGREGVDGDGAGMGKEEVGTRMVRCDVGLEEVGWGVRAKCAEDGEGGAGGIGKGVWEVLGRWCREE